MVVKENSCSYLSSVVRNELLDNWVGSWCPLLVIVLIAAAALLNAVFVVQCRQRGRSGRCFMQIWLQFSVKKNMRTNCPDIQASSDSLCPWPDCCILHKCMFITTLYSNTVLWGEQLVNNDLLSTLLNVEFGCSKLNLLFFSINYFATFNAVLKLCVFNVDFYVLICWWLQIWCMCNIVHYFISTNARTHSMAK